MSDKNKKEYVSLYLPKELAKAVNDLKEGDTQNEIILKYIESCKTDMRASIESMDEDVLIFRGLMATAKRGFKETRDEYLDSSYAIWEETDKQLPSIKAKTEKLIKELKPLKDELDHINETIKSIDRFQIEKFVEFIAFFNNTVHGENENILKYLMETYKRA